MGDSQNWSSSANVIVQLGRDRIPSPRKVDNINQQQTVRRGDFAHRIGTRHELTLNLDTSMFAHGGHRSILYKSVWRLHGPYKPQLECTRSKGAIADQASHRTHKRIR